MSLGLTTFYGSGNMATNIFASYDHIRVLFYDGLPCRDEHWRYANLNVSAERLEPFVRRALELVESGFDVPVPPLTNHAPNARLCYRLFHRYPKLAEAARRIWLGGLLCDKLRHEPRRMFKQYVGEVPPDLDDAVAGRVGFPPGPDINEVTGRPPPKKCSQ